MNTEMYKLTVLLPIGDRYEKHQDLHLHNESHRVLKYVHVSVQ